MATYDDQEALSAYLEGCYEDLMFKSTQEKIDFIVDMIYENRII
jgi:hypothetical protein